ncbi:hypothetical protein BJI69_20015 [Luteibacter rhizovicinus DSM 16549]|uniref:Uncharacterized protein n=1 Tax=Luteibacter rhizovicinus DSM 16549 TaxID=1440763 RepID=A0A0G9HBA0_9GAMM|nr:hypothetical protein [Luteibacter rhizovicinus]APG05962.1 hypothetical protein BJI69_20015 [Luteibacter rhizovicinus DSM 16549]KLD67090.1 hypothetical protein Y883_08965 [Luteibacter rhizovicinus DSM 16549]KLD77636.1 hypothetical protein Y886_14680 [Xanthomonas hyacinthi DSM 19077]
MNDGLFYLYADLSCSAVMMACGCWLLTDRHLGRVLRVCHAFIAAGALVNVLGIVADRVGFHDISYGHVWPGEVMTNIGTAVLMSKWVWRSMRRRQAALGDVV